MKGERVPNRHPLKFLMFSANLAVLLALASSCGTRITALNTLARNADADLGPRVAITSPAALSGVNNSNWSSFPVSGTCSENAEDVVITGDATATVACTAGAWTANLDFSAAADGTVTIDVNHSDADGNAAPQVSRSFQKSPLPGAFVISSTVPGHQKVTLTWGASAGAVSYTVKYGTVSGNWSTTFSTSATSPLDVTGLTNGTLYYFMVTAVAPGGTTDATAETSATPNLLLVTTGPASVATGVCSSTAYTITAEDAGGTPYPVPSNLTVTLSSGGSNVNFYAAADTTCSGSTITSVVIASGSSTETFYMKTNLAQALDVGGSATGYVTDSLSVTSAWSPTRIDLVAGTTIGAESTDAPNGTDARFNSPFGVALDSANNILYVADTYNCTVRKVDLGNNNATTTIAGTVGTCGIVDGNGAAARFIRMYGLTYDGARYLYATDGTNCAIRKIDTQAPYAVTTILGTAGCGIGEGAETSTKVSRPHGIVYSTVSDSGTGPFLYIASQRYNQIVRLDLGVATTDPGYGKIWVGSLAGTAGTTDASGTTARLSAPTGLAVDGTKLYVTEKDNAVITGITLTTAAKTTLNNSGADSPTGIAVVGTNLYYQTSSFSQGGEIHRMTNAGASDTRIAGQPSQTTTEFYNGDYDHATGTSAYFNFRNLGFSFASDANFIYVPDTYNNTIRKIGVNSPHPVTTIAGFGSKGANSTDNATGTSARFKQISSSTTDGTSIFITEKRDGTTIRKYNIATGAVTTLAGSSTATGCTDGAPGVALFTQLRSSAYRSGYIYAFDEGCGLRKIDATTGVVTTMTLSGADAALPGAYAMTVYGNDLYIGSFTTYRILKIDLTAASPQPVVRIAGDGTYGDDTTGLATTAKIGRATSLFVNSTHIYFYDWANIRIKRIDYTATNNVSVFAGAGSTGLLSDGTGASIALTGPFLFGGIAGDATNLYFLDCDGGVLRKINLSTGVSSMMSGNTAAGYYGNWVEQRELDGVYSTASGANMVQGTHSLTLTPHGLFTFTQFGIRWVH